jgi:HPt (histidine-containing phosphotransfer) domain-containing protein
MSRTRIQRPPIHSSLSGDPVLGEIVELFVAELPQRTKRIERHLDLGDWEALRQAAHQLKGAAGSHGFDQLTTHALRVEALAAKQAPPQEIRAAVAELVDQCRRATAEPAG